MVQSCIGHMFRNDFVKASLANHGVFLVCSLRYKHLDYSCHESAHLARNRSLKYLKRLFNMGFKAIKRFVSNGHAHYIDQKSISHSLIISCKLHMPAAQLWLTSSPFQPFSLPSYSTHSGAWERFLKIIFLASCWNWWSCDMLPPKWKSAERMSEKISHSKLTGANLVGTGPSLLPLAADKGVISGVTATILWCWKTLHGRITETLALNNQAIKPITESQNLLTSRCFLKWQKWSSIYCFIACIWKHTIYIT